MKIVNKRKKSERAHKGSPWVHLEIKGMTSSRHPSAEVTAERLVQMESGRCFPEVRKTIQSKQFLKYLEKGLKFKISRYTKQKGKINI